MSSLLDRLPPLATTGIGSLPFNRPTDAASHVVSAYELPFCPQLPRAYGDMVVEWLGADPGRCGWAPDRDRQLPAVWDPFVLELCRRPPAHRLVKLQVTGPVTLAMALEPAARGDDRCGLAREISTWLAAAVAGQAGELAELGFDAILVVDEPGVAAAGLRPTEIAVWDPLRAAVQTWGLHVCGAVPWDLVDAAEPDLMSFDLVRYEVTPSARRVLTKLISRGGRVMWGVFDPVAPQPVEAATRQIASACASLSHGLSHGGVVAASLVSGCCGSGFASIDDERTVAASLRAAATTVRAGSEIFGLDVSGAQGAGEPPHVALHVRADEHLEIGDQHAGAVVENRVVSLKLGVGELILGMGEAFGAPQQHLEPVRGFLPAHWMHES